MIELITMSKDPFPLESAEINSDLVVLLIFQAVSVVPYLPFIIPIMVKSGVKFLVLLGDGRYSESCVNVNDSYESVPCSTESCVSGVVFPGIGGNESCLGRIIRITRF